jgi:hypothetical protein
MITNARTSAPSTQTHMITKARTSTSSTQAHMVAKARTSTSSTQTHMVAKARTPAPSTQTHMVAKARTSTSSTQMHTYLSKGLKISKWPKRCSIPSTHPTPSSSIHPELVEGCHPTCPPTCPPKLSLSSQFYLRKRRGKHWRRRELVEGRSFVCSYCLSVKDIVLARACFDKLNMSGKEVEIVGNLFCDLSPEALAKGEALAKMKGESLAFLRSFTCVSEGGSSVFLYPLVLLAPSAHPEPVEGCCPACSYPLTLPACHSFSDLFFVASAKENGRSLPARRSLVFLRSYSCVGEAGSKDVPYERKGSRHSGRNVPKILCFGVNK